MPSLDSRHILEYAALFGGMAALFCLNLYFERRECRRKAGLVRSNLAAKRCSRCEGTLSDWDGRFHSGDVHFNPGGYLPMILVRCPGCRAETWFHVDWEGRVFDRDVLFGGFTAGEHAT